MAERNRLPDRRHPAHPPVVSLGNRCILVFLTVCTKDRRRLLGSAAVHDVIKQKWCEADAWSVGRYVVMPDHVHLFCAPVGPEFALAQWVTFWKHNVTRELHVRSLVVGDVWQKDYWDTQLREGDSYTQKWGYVRTNPVRARLVSCEDDWPHQGEIMPLMWHEV